MKQNISISLEDYQIRMLKEIETFINEETDLYIPNRSIMIGYIIQKMLKHKDLLKKI